MHSWYDCWWVDTRHHLLYGQWGNKSGVLTPWEGLLLSWQINTGHLRYPVTYLFPGIIIQIFGTFVMERSPVLANVVFWAVMDVHIVTVSSSVATEIPCNIAKSYTIFYNLLHIRYFSRGGGLRDNCVFWGEGGGDAVITFTCYLLHDKRSSSTKNSSQFILSVYWFSTGFMNIMQ